MKNVLVLIHDDVGQEARLQAALDVTRAVGGHLQCLDVVEMPLVVDGFYGGTGEMMLLQDARTRERENKARLTARLAHEGVAWSWTDAVGDLAACVVDAAATADLIVVNRKLDSFPAPDMRAVATAILTDCDTPVLAVPDDCARFDAAGPALIGWDGSEPAMNAIQRAQPLLALAGAVRIVQIGERDAGIPIEDAAQWLSRHGVTPDVAMLPRDGDIADTLHEAARTFGAAYVVMGAYKRRPTTEALFGGVTRAMLTHSPLPLILAH
jgi:nucleotide-binding universal stress UspA family protein